MEKGLCKKWFDRLEVWIEKIINGICVAAITIQVLAILVMVFGRYFFSYVPMGTEELALFCMVWFSLLSISLSVRDDSHVKMEVVDKLFPEKAVWWIKICSGAAVMVFAVLMIYYGISLVKLVSGTVMSAMRISKGWLYLAIPVSGFCIALCDMGYMLRLFRGDENEH